jgi:hypothetical protein
VVTRRKKVAVAEVGTRGQLRRSTTWAGLKRGDPVDVTGTRLRRATWAFVAHVTNLETGEEWVEVVGGRSGDRSVRSFHPSQLFPPRPTTSGGRGTRAAPRRPSFADAPQLPLG